MSMLLYIQTFVSVAQTNSFTLAAKQLNISSSYVSKQISLLETELNTKLVLRTTRKLSLTHDGIQFYARCKNIISDAENAKNELIEQSQKMNGLIRITLAKSLILCGFGKCFSEFQKQYPDIKLHISTSGQNEDLIEENFDLAIRVGKLKDSTLISRKLFDCQLIVVGSPTYFDQHGVPKSPNDILKHNCIIYDESDSNHRWPFVSSVGESIFVKADGNIVTNDANVLLDTALSGLGIIIGPCFMFAKSIEDNLLQPVLLDNAVSMEITALYPLNRILPHRLRVFLDFILERVNEKYFIN